MTEAELLSKVIDVFQKVTKAPEITGDMNLMEDLSLSSIETLTILVGIENEFSIKIPERLMRRMVTINDVASIVLEIINKSHKS